MSIRGSRPSSLYGGDDHIPGVASVDHSGVTDSSFLSGGMGDDGSMRDGISVLQRTNSQMSQTGAQLPSRGGTLKKKASLKRGSSLKRSGSRRSSYAGSVRSLRVGEKDRYDPEEYNSAFYCPVPTAGSPTDLLADRFQAWRKVLKDLINYFRDVHKSYDVRSKTLLSASNLINNTAIPPEFLATAGLGAATTILQQFHKDAISEAQRARELENEVILQLTGLRSDLSQKIKEIKSLSGDFKNSVGREQDNTRKAVNAFQEALGMVDRDASATAGKGDPFIQRMGVERQLERQIEEENYLHRAYRNLEASGRELESIVVGEIQKAYQVLAGVHKRDADASYDMAEKLREGPLAMAKDHEWDAFVTNNEKMVDPSQPLRQAEQIIYPGKNHPAGVDVRSGMLERKSKYLKNYTPGWYILSPTHLHEYKSADRIPYQQPVMSLYLPEQKLGSHSELGSSSNKFMLKGRQTGSMHRGHTWIFRAESHDTMMAWYADLKELTEKRGEARNEFVRRTHARSTSGSSLRAPSVASGDSQLEEDEADRVAFSSEQSVRGLPMEDTQTDMAAAAGINEAAGITAVAADDGRSEAGWRPPQQRPQPGGRFPSEVNVTRGLRAPLSASSGNSDDERERETIAKAATLPGTTMPFVAGASGQPQGIPVDESKNDWAGAASVPREHGQHSHDNSTYTAGQHSRIDTTPAGAADVSLDTRSTYKEWMGTMGAVGAGGAAGAAAGTYVAEHRPAERPDEGAGESTESVSAPRSGDAVASESVTRGGLINGTDVRSAKPAGSTVLAPSDLTPATDPNTTPALHYAHTGNDVELPGITTAATTSAGVVHTLSVAGGDLAATDAAIRDDMSPVVRPAPISAKSVQTISDLHIPGEFPDKSESIRKVAGQPARPN